MPSTPAVTAFQAPSLALLATEPLRAVLDLFSVRVSHPPLVRGDGHPVVIYPGLGAGTMTTSQLRGYLRACNFRVHDWDLGINIGPDSDFDLWLGPLVERVRALHRDSGRTVSLVGWSLGGVYAREIARIAPEAVRQVITLATPFHSLGSANHAGTLFQLLGGDRARLTPEMQARMSATPPVPTTSIFSKDDGIVCWRGCLEQAGPQVENVMVRGSHIGMPTNPKVLQVIADRLAQPETAWRPYRRRRLRFTPPIAPTRSRK